MGAYILRRILISIPVLVGIFPVWSHQLALRLHNEVPGIVVPDRVLNALRDAGPGAADRQLMNQA